MSTHGGHREGSGRPRGSLGVKTIAVMEKLEKLNCDPIEALANIAQDTNNTPELRFQANKELAQYVAPKRKAVELDALVDGGVNVNVIKFSDLKSNLGEEEEKEE